MKSLGNVLHDRRTHLGLGMRELCVKSERADKIAEPIHPSYYSRLERGVEVDLSKVSIEKCWALGLVLQVDPLELFVLSRPAIDQRYADATERARLFPVDCVEPTTLPELLRGRRTDMGFGLRELTNKLAGNSAAVFPLSAGFLSQIETNFRGLASVVSGDKLWALGVILGINPLVLYVVSRGLDSSLLNPGNRRVLFGI